MDRTPRSRPLPAIALVLAAALIAGACGAGGDPISAPAVAVVDGTSANATTTAVSTATTARPVTTTTAPPTTAPPTTAPSTTLPPTTVPATTAPRRPIVLGFAGDTSFTHGLDGRNPFGAITDLLSAPDLMTVNLETAVAEEGVGAPPVVKEFLFRSPPASVGLLAAAGIDAVALANNHSLDYGNDALDRTIQVLDEGGVVHTGASPSAGDPWPGRILQVGDWRVGVASFTRVPCDWAGGGDRLGVAWACPAFLDQVDRGVDALVAGSDVTAVMLHGGTEGQYCPDQFMRDLFTHLAERGVDLVISGHPHRLQGVERIGDTWVVDSMGNFTFPSAQQSGADSAVFLFEVAESGIGLRVEPVRTPRGVAERPDAATRQRILDHIAAHSDRIGFDADGRAVGTDQPGACA